jgi:CheY-like chemotaxis protein
MPYRNVARQKHIFAINASPDYLNVLHEGLQEQGFSVTATNFVPKSFDQIVALQPDAVIVDVAVGERSGWDLLERLPAEAATSGIPVLITSTDPRLLDRAREQAALCHPSLPGSSLRCAGPAGSPARDDRNGVASL